MKKYIFAIIFTALFAIDGTAKSEELVVYSARKEHLIKPVFDKYTQETGQKIKFITDKAGPLLARLKAEGENTPADVLITVDAGNLWKAVQDGVLKQTRSSILEGNIPTHLRDPELFWYGFSVRARTIFYNTEKVQTSELSSYEDLGKPQWKGRLCLRTSKKVYNQSLVAMLIASHGEEKAEQIVKSWVANLATEPFSSDTKMLEAIAAGQCDVGVANTYYYGRLIKKDPSIPLGIFWPNQQNYGVHVNVSGAGVTRYSRHPKEARKFLEWLSSEKAQKLFADVNLEYPVNAAVTADPLVQSWGEFKQNLINVNEAGNRQAQAVMLMDRAAYK